MRLTPASRAASTLARSGPVQYSSCPTDRNVLVLRQVGGPGADVDVGRVRDVDAVALEEAQGRVLVAVEEVAAARERRGSMYGRL